jgi:aspartate racemase
VQGRLRRRLARRLAGIVARQVARGADGVLLGCTELTLSLTQADVEVPLFDTTALHALAAVDFSLASRCSGSHRS